MTSPEAVRAAHPDWTIRHDAGQDWACWTAQRVRVITAPTLGELAARLSQAEGVMAGDPRALLARYQWRLHELLDVLGQDAREAGS